MSWLPTDMPNLVAWWDASDSLTITNDGSGKCSQWNDKSPNANHLTQGTAGSRPTITAAGLNGLGVLTFAGSQKLTKASGAVLPDNSAGYTVTCVAKESATGAYFFYVGPYTLAAEAIALYTDANWLGVRNNGVLLGHNAVAAVGTTANILTCRLDASVANVYLNRVVGSFTGAGYNHNFTGNNNCGVGDSLNGYIAEIIVASGTSTTDQSNMESYVSTKWGFPAPTAAAGRRSLSAVGTRIGSRQTHRG